MAKKVLEEFDLPDENSFRGDIIDHVAREQELLNRQKKASKSIYDNEAGKLKDKTDFFVLINFVNQKVKRNGLGYLTECPVCKHDPPSLIISNKTKRYRCAKCDESGDMIDYIKHIKKVDFKKALKLLRNLLLEQEKKKEMKKNKDRESDLSPEETVRELGNLKKKLNGNSQAETPADKTDNELSLADVSLNETDQMDSRKKTKKTSKTASINDLVSSPEPEKGKSNKKKNETAGKPEKQPGTPSFFKKNDLLYFDFPDIRYKIAGVTEDFTTSLRLNIRVIHNDNSKTGTVNLYEDNQLTKYIHKISEALDIPEKTLDDHLDKITEILEKNRDEEREKKNRQKAVKQVYILKPDERKKTLDIITKSDIIKDHLLPDMEQGLKHTGEEINKEICYHAILSRYYIPINPCTISPYGKGKSYLHQCICKLVPDEDLKEYSRITKNDLFYKDEENAFQHKIISIDEVKGLKESLYAVRSLISSGFLSVSYTRMDPTTGKLRSDENRVHGKPVFFCTATHDNDLDPETKSRFTILSTDPSNEQRARIRQKQFENLTLSGMKAKRQEDEIIKKHQNILRLMDKITVIMPSGWSKDIEKMLTDGDLEARDNLTYISLMITHAMRHQHSRKVYKEKDKYGEIKYIELNKPDIERANYLYTHIRGRSVKDLDPPVFFFLQRLQDYVLKKAREKNGKPKHFTFHQKEIRETLRDFNAWQVSTYFSKLMNLEYMAYAGTGKFNLKKYRLLAIEPLKREDKFLPGLIDPAELS